MSGLETMMKLLHRYKEAVNYLRTGSMLLFVIQSGTDLSQVVQVQNIIVSLLTE
jgi:hypothetical protein